MRVSDFINALAVLYTEDNNGIEARFFFQDSCSTFVPFVPPSLHPLTEAEDAFEWRCGTRDDVAARESNFFSTSKNTFFAIPTASSASSSSDLDFHTSTENLHALRGQHWSRIAAIVYGVSLSDSLPSCVSGSPMWITEGGVSSSGGGGTTSRRTSSVKATSVPTFLSPSQIEQHCHTTLQNTFHGDFQRYCTHYRDLFWDTWTAKNRNTTVHAERSSGSLRAQIPTARSHAFLLTDAVRRILPIHSISPLSEKKDVGEHGEWRPPRRNAPDKDEDIGSSPKEVVQDHPPCASMPKEELERDPTSPCGRSSRCGAWFANDEGSPSGVMMRVAWESDGRSSEGVSGDRNRRVLPSFAWWQSSSGAVNCRSGGGEDVGASTFSHLACSSIPSRNTSRLEQQFEWEKARDRAPYYSNAPDGLHAVAGVPRKERDKENAWSRFPSPPPSWSMTLSPEQRSFLARLRQTPLSPELLSSFVQEFSLVEGGPVFFHDVGPEMMVEYNGMQAGPYRKVIAVPLSLLTMRRCVADSRYQYDHCPSLFRHLPSSKDNDFSRTDTSNFVDFGRISSANPSTTGAPHDGETNRMPTASLLGSRYPSVTGVLPEVDWKAYDYQLLTLLDLERMVWHIAANCVFFNAPETWFRPTATKFALACSHIIQQYCMKQLYSSSIP